MGSDQFFDFNLLNENQLNATTEANEDLTQAVVSEFLQLLGDRWSQFFRMYLDVPKERLLPFIKFDLSETAVKHLLNCPAARFASLTGGCEVYLLSLRIRLTDQNEELRRFDSGMQDLDNFSRIIHLCCELYEQDFQRSEQVPSKNNRILPLIGCHETSPLLLENYEILADMMQYIEKNTLKDRMISAFENNASYGLRDLVGIMSDRLNRVLNRPTDLAQTDDLT